MCVCVCVGGGGGVVGGTGEFGEHWQITKKY